MAAKESVVQTDFEQKISVKATVQLTVKCRIEKFESLMNSYKPGEHLWSGDVLSELVPHAVWKLVVNPKSLIGAPTLPSISTSRARCYGFQADDKEILEARYHLYLIDGTQSKTDSINSGTYKFGVANCYSWPGNIEATEASYDQVKKALQADGSLVVAADIEFLAPDVKAIRERAFRGYEDRERWGVKFSELHGDAASSDCTIEIGGESIPAHKYPLMAQSPIFRRMFTNPMAEEFESCTVKVSDFKEAGPMRALIRYCYLGQLDTETMDGEGTTEIFKLADRYCIAGLKVLLELHFIDKRLSVTNVVGMAALADSYNAPKLKDACVKLLAREGKTVFESADWENLKKARPELAIDLAVAAYIQK